MILILIIFELVLFWPLIFIVNRWLRKLKLANSGLIASVLVLFTFVIITFGYNHLDEMYLNPEYRTIQFDSDTWKSGEKKRFSMLLDIMENNLFIGKTKNEIITLLGKDYETRSDNCIGYSVIDPGNGFGFQIDHDVLVVDFDSLGHVIRIRRDSW